MHFFLLMHFFDFSVPCVFSTDSIQKYFQKMKISEIYSLPVLLVPANIHLAELTKSSAATQGLFMLLWAVCVIASRANRNLKEKNCQAAAGGLQTIHGIWWKFNLTYVTADNKQTAGEYDSCYP